jgi:thioredoxin-dependent peroxiredoxin
VTPVAAVGAPAPDFTLEGTDGPFTLSEHRGERVVLLFYTMDRGSVCARQFRSYSLNQVALEELGATVVGINGQGLESHRRFQHRDAIPVPLLSDPELAVATAYGAAIPVVGTRRSVMVVDEQGVLRHRHVHTVGVTFATVADLRRVLAELG